MLAQIASFAVVVSVRLALGANIRALPVAPSCPRVATGLQSEPVIECTASIEWRGDGFNDEYCRAAIQRLYNIEVTKHGNTEFEFLLPGAIPYTSNPVMQTPRRYRVGQSRCMFCCFSRKVKEEEEEEEEEKPPLLQR